MKTSKLIELLKREVGTVESNNVIDKMRDEIIEKLRQLETLREILSDAEISFVELFSFLSKITLED